MQRRRVPVVRDLQAEVWITGRLNSQFQQVRTGRYRVARIRVEQAIRVKSGRFEQPPCFTTTSLERLPDKDINRRKK